MDNTGKGIPPAGGWYGTRLTPEQEAAYRLWVTTLPERLRGDYDYDLRGAWLAGDRPDGEGHMTDRWKKPWHPTFSEESVYSRPGVQGGRWEGDTFVPSAYNKWVRAFTGANEGKCGGELKKCGGKLYSEGGVIHIKKENRGKFTAAADRAGMGVQAYARHVLANKGSYSPTLVKRANFARSAAKWHADGGNLFLVGGEPESPWHPPMKAYSISGVYPAGTFGMTAYTGGRNPMDIAVGYQMNRLHSVENAGNVGYDPRTGRYTAYDSVEGGEKTVGDGLKLLPGQPWTDVYNRQGYLTKEQHDRFVRERIQKDWNATRAFYDKINGGGSFDKLSPEWQGYAIDFNYNPGVTRFPNLMRAIHSGDTNAIKRESSRMTGGKPLGRNRVMNDDVDRITEGRYTGQY